MYSFEFVRPSQLSEAIEALSSEDSLAIAGGQTLIPTLKNRLAQPDKLVSLGAISSLGGVTVHGNESVEIGATTTHAEVAGAVADVFPALADLAHNIGDPAVRNRGTIGGSLANNDPSACYPSVALATNATIVTNSREIKAEEFFVGMFETALEHGEIITKVEFPIPDEASYQKFEQPASRFALVGVFVARFGSDVRIAVTGASEGGVFRWTEAEKACNSDFSTETVKALAVSADGMIGDIHGSSEYRAHLVRVLTGRGVAAAC